MMMVAECGDIGGNDDDDDNNDDDGSYYNDSGKKTDYSILSKLQEYCRRF